MLALQRSSSLLSLVLVLLGLAAGCVTARPLGPTDHLGTVEVWSGTPHGPIVVDGERLEANNAYVHFDGLHARREVVIGNADTGVTVSITCDGTLASFQVLHIADAAQLTVNATAVPRGDRLPIAKRVVFRTITNGARGPMMQLRFYAPGESTGPTGSGHQNQN